jgi:hypothetical protein
MADEEGLQARGDRFGRLASLACPHVEVKGNVWKIARDQIFLPEDRSVRRAVMFFDNPINVTDPDGIASAKDGVNVLGATQTLCHHLLPGSRFGFLLRFRGAFRRFLFVFFFAT